MESRVEEFENEDLSIDHVALLDYITEPLSQADALYDVLEMIDENTLKNLFGDKVARRIIDDDPDIAAYLKEDVGGVLIKAFVRLPDEKTVKFDKNNNPRSWYSSPYQRVVYALAPDVDDAIDELIKQARKLKQEQFNKARILQIEAEKGSK